MATIQVVLHTAAYLDEADPDYELGKRAAYRMTIELDDADQALADAEEGKALDISGINAVSWDRVPGIDGPTQSLASPPTGITVSVGQVTPDNVSTGKRRIHYDSTPPGADHPTRWVGWATVGTVWVGVPVVDPGDVPDDFDDPGTGLAILHFNNLSCSGTPIQQNIGLPYWISVNNGDLTGVGGDASASCRGAFKIPVAGTYRFKVGSDEGCRLFIDGVPLIDSWNTSYDDRYSGFVEFTLNQIVNVRLEHFNSSNANSLYIAWSIDGAAYELIPIEVMYPIGWDAPFAEQPRPVQAAFGVDTVKRYF
jgi:hypothetical protein